MIIRIFAAITLSTLILFSQLATAKTRLVQKPVTRTVPVERSHVEVKYAIADYYWKHHLVGHKEGWSQVAVEATLANTIIIHVVNANKDLDRFTISSHDIQRIGNMDYIRFKNGSVTTLEWVEEEVDPRFDFPLVSPQELKKWDHDNRHNGIDVALGHVIDKVKSEHLLEDLRIHSLIRPDYPRHFLFA